MRRGLVALASLPLLCLPSARAADAPPASPAPAATVPDAAAEAPAWQEPDPMPLPPGTPADQELWKAARDVNNQVAAARWAANALQWKIQRTDPVGRLNAAARADPAAEGRYVALRTRLTDAQAENYKILMGRWPVDTTRVCQYPQSQLTSAMYAEATPDGKASLAEARTVAGNCVDVARAAAARMERSTAALSATLDEVEKALAAPAPAGSGGK